MDIEWFDRIQTKIYGSSLSRKQSEIKLIEENGIGSDTLRKETGAIEKTALESNPQGYRRRGREKRTWRRTIEDEIRGTRRSWNEDKEIAGDRINL
jgi:hypothetical protein